MSMSHKVIARLKGPFSLTGEVRLQFIDLELAHYLVSKKIPLTINATGAILTPVKCRQVPKGVAFYFEEVADRNAAETLPKGELSAPIELLPAVSNENYTLEDLVGVTVYLDNHDKAFATVTQASNYGASDVLECTLLQDMCDKEKGGVFSVPLTPDIIIDLDFEKRILTVTNHVDFFIKA